MKCKSPNDKHATDERPYKRLLLSSVFLKHVMIVGIKRKIEM